VPEAKLLVNNAGGAKGLEPVADADEDDWRWMWETNVAGTLRLTQAFLPKLRASGDGHIVTVTSIAALDFYDNGAGYTGAKHAQAMLHRTLRGELLGEPIRITEICPGMVETEFSEVRLGDAEKAAKVYEGLTPLTADGRRRHHRLRRDPAVARQPGPDRAQAARPGVGHAAAPALEGLLRPAVLVGVVTGALAPGGAGDPFLGLAQDLFGTGFGALLLRERGGTAGDAVVGNAHGGRVPARTAPTTPSTSPRTASSPTGRRRGRRAARGCR
jgi:NAD(P)-dependent dehydrogenase (short-subunit alcohol dehydrogenase family)